MKLERQASLLLKAGILLAVLVLAGCKGATGPAGPPGVNPGMSPRISAVLAVPDSVGAGQAAQLLVSAYSPNGDSLTYLWTASIGTLSHVNRAATSWTAPDSAVIALIKVVVSSAAHGSAADSIAIGVNRHTPTVLPSYLGTDAASCGHCHGATVAQWMTTPHSVAFDTLTTEERNSPYCLQCHTTGFTDRYDSHDVLLERGPNNGGYNNNPLPALQSVQCEQCHGPMGPNPALHVPDLLGPLAATPCANCHAAYPDYITTGHYLARANHGGQAGFYAEWSRPGSDCKNCHFSEGFLIQHDPDWANRTIDPATVQPVICATCHDPHEVTPADNESELRTIAAVKLPYTAVTQDSFVVNGLGKGQLCAQCHHSRKNHDQITAQFPNGNAFPGPHDSPQTDMLVGQGDWEVAGSQAISRESQHSFLTNGCVDCHMIDRENADPAHMDPVHTMLPQLGQCIVCHPGATDFNINGIQTEIHHLLDSLGTYLPPVGSPTVMDSTNNPAWTPEMRQAGWTWYFVANDKSFGVHNRDYARTILLNAIDYIRAHSSQEVLAAAEHRGQ
jgi:hypothetical protein